MEIVRFRADPENVRVSIKKVYAGWQATVRSRETGNGAVVVRPSASQALVIALERAEGVEGVDVDMAYTYPHPWKGGPSDTLAIIEDG